MRKLKLVFLAACVIVFGLIAPGRFQHWNATNADYETAQARVATIKPSGPTTLNLSDLINLTTLPPEIATKTSLTRLNLSDTNLSDIKELHGLKNLQYLALNNVPITDLSPLSGLRNLVDLSISRTWAFDLAPIAGLSRLKQLNLSYTAVKSLRPVMQLRRIQQLTLYSSYAHDGSGETYAKLVRSLPRVNNGNAYKQNYQPDWIYRLKIQIKRFRYSWMIERPQIS